jgi:hypothetical protein
MSEPSLSAQDAAQEPSAEALALLHRPAGKRPAFFPQTGVDQLFSLVIELAAEVWVLRERVYAIEDLSQQNGTSLRSQVERWAPSVSQAQELANMRHAMMQNLFRTIDTDRVPRSDEGAAADPTPPGSVR